MTPDLSHLADVVLTPVVLDSSVRLGYSFGAFDSTGAFIEPMTLRRDWGITGRREPEPPHETLSGPHLYGGFWFGQFGHFMLESLARLWALRPRPELPVLWHPVRPELEPHPWQRDVLELLEIDPGRIRFIRAPLRVEELLLPEPGYVVRDHAHPAQIRALAAFPFRPPEPGRRIWLSRSGLPDRKGRVLGEEVVEHALVAEGWTILHTETMGIRAQLEALSGAELIAGFAGSAFHLLLLGEGVRARVRIINRRPILNRNFLTIAAAKGLDQQVGEVELEPAGGGQRAGTEDYRLVEPQQVLDFLAR